jgi:hypothetical protein
MLSRAALTYSDFGFEALQALNQPSLMASAKALRIDVSDHMRRNQGRCLLIF